MLSEIKNTEDLLLKDMNRKIYEETFMEEYEEFLVPFLSQQKFNRSLYCNEFAPTENH